MSSNGKRAALWNLTVKDQKAFVFRGGALLASKNSEVYKNIVDCTAITMEGKQFIKEFHLVEERKEIYYSVPINSLYL